MANPLASFTSYTPGDGSLLSEMELSWGTDFEQLTQSEKLWMLSYVTGAIVASVGEHYDPFDVTDVVNDACERLFELSFSNQLGLAKFLIANL